LISPLADGLPDFPWDTIADAANRARSHSDGIVDLSIGTPIDDSPQFIQEALRQASNAPGYPTAAGTIELRTAWAEWANRILSAQVTEKHIAISIGSKEMVALLPFALGVGPTHTIAIPELAYPTYAVGALMIGATCVTYRSAADIPDGADFVWINTPSNPTGEVLDVESLKAIVDRAREIHAPVISDECYVELGWTADPVSVLDPRVNGGDLSGIAALFSLSKRSNLAGYRSGAMIGDEHLVSSVVGFRKHAGLLMPFPVQVASVAALNDDAHVAEQKVRYSARRDVLHTALTSAGFSIHHSQAGLYLWATRGDDCRTTVDQLSELGILVAPGSFYGPAGDKHVRVALTASDERVAAAALRLAVG